MHWFSAVQRANLEALSRVNPHMAAELRALDGLYLFGTIGSEAALLRDGSVQMWVAESWPTSETYTQRRASPEERIGALVLGAEKWPELKALLPTRAPDASSCERCSGGGRVKSRVLCPDCSGLGFIARAI
jgi:hypothetical protein